MRENSELTQRKTEPTELLESKHLLATIFSNVGSLEIIRLEVAAYKDTVTRLPAYDCSLGTRL